MNAIMGMSELALDSGVSPKQHEYLTIVQSSSAALLHLINDILTSTPEINTHTSQKACETDFVLHPQR
jgi:hypothetical protein